MKSLIDRLKDRCHVDDDEDGCWIWKQHVNSAGYPTVHFSGLTNGPMPVRRIMFAIACGPLHARRVITSTCGEERCINPAHLKSIPRAVLAIQTIRETNARMSTIDRQQAAQRRRDISARRLDRTKAEQIRQAVAAGNSHALVAASFDVSRSTVSKIIQGKMWAPLPTVAWHP